MDDEEAEWERHLRRRKRRRALLYHFLLDQSSEAVEEKSDGRKSGQARLPRWGNLDSSVKLEQWRHDDMCRKWQLLLYDWMEGGVPGPRLLALLGVPAALRHGAQGFR